MMNSQADENRMEYAVSQASATVNVSVSVSYVATGGNALSGAYQYSCTPDVVHVTEPNAVINYALSAEAVDEFRITGVYTSDSFYHPQLAVASKLDKLGLKSINLIHKNELPTLINVALQVTHITSQLRISCDPQVTNEPNPS